MFYLICEKCGGYYTLKEGEKPEDFEMCECGGSLRYIQNFNSHIDEELDPINEINICPDCGTESPSGEKHSKSRGKMAKNTKNKKTDSSNAEYASNEFKIPHNLILRTISIIVGILIVVIPTFLIGDQNYALALLLIAGVVVSLIAGGTTEDGALDGVIMGLIAALIVLIFRGNYLYVNDYDLIFNIYYFFIEMGGAVLILALFGLVGGIIGSLIRDLLIKTEKK